MSWSGILCTHIQVPGEPLNSCMTLVIWFFFVSVLVPLCWHNNSTLSNYLGERLHKLMCLRASGLVPGTEMQILHWLLFPLLGLFPHLWSFSPLEMAFEILEDQIQISWQLVLINLDSITFHIYCLSTPCQYVATFGCPLWSSLCYRCTLPCLER